MKITGLRFQQRDQFLHIRRRQRGMHHQHVLRDGHHGDRRKVLDRIVGQLAETDVDRDRRDVTHDDRVTVGLRLCSQINADGAAGTAAIVDHHGMAPALTELLRQRARQKISAAARRQRHDETHRALGKGGERRASAQSQRCAGNGAQHPTHRVRMHSGATRHRPESPYP